MPRTPSTQSRSEDLGEVVRDRGIGQRPTITSTNSVRKLLLQSGHVWLVLNGSAQEGVK